jgi:two-component system chemotaxis sensor kinase CheA
MLDIYIYETTQNIEQLETSILASEKAGSFTPDMINEIFRIMHTIKGSSAMMTFNNIASLAHAIEDLFYVIRENKPESVDYNRLSDLVLEGADFIKLELEKVKNSVNLDGDPAKLLESVGKFLSSIKGGANDAPPPVKKSKTSSTQKPSLLPGGGCKPGQKMYEAVRFFEDGCQMENLRAYAILHNLKDIVEDFRYFPKTLEEAKTASGLSGAGFQNNAQKRKMLRELHEFFAGGMFVRDLELSELRIPGVRRPGAAGYEGRERQLR